MGLLESAGLDLLRPLQGVVVYLDGGNGESANGESVEDEMLQYYVQQGYEVVQVAWGGPWEQQDTNPNIQNAACRPATFLNYVYTNIFAPAIKAPAAGFCAQGFSAGSAAIAYSMAYYGEAGQLDNVELISGPVLSDLKQGCEYPNASNVTVCPSGQWGCAQHQRPWALPPTYVGFDVGYIRNWTGENACAGTTNTSSWNDTWLSESIVDVGGTTGATPTFSYPNTAMTGWLCSTVLAPPNGVNCSTGYQYSFCPNNSSPQGEIFYSQFTQSNSPPHYAVWGVDGCNGPEGAPDGSVTAMSGEPRGYTAMQQDMAGGSQPDSLPAQCFHGIHKN
jgi:hypothetical protein